MRSSHMYQVSLVGGLAAFASSFVAGVLGALIVRYIGTLAFFALFYAPAIGPTVGRMIIRASGGKRGIKLALIASAGFIIGAIGSSAGLALVKGGSVAMALMLLWNPFLWIMTAIAVGSLWVFLK